MSVNPTNPKIPKGRETPDLGQTRPTTTGGVDWFDASQQAWRPAVRQDIIRDRLLRQAKAQEGTYVHPHGQGTGNNETAPLREDLNYGSAWADRPDLLFQLRPNHDQRCVEPTGVLIYHGRVMLDPFDHPIRDFGRDLPIVLSTELKGDEVEHYLRKNLAIKIYDLIARMPNGYTVINRTYTGPPRILTLRERATKFREKAGCLAWTKRDGSGCINDFILSLLPAGATTTRSLGRDLTAQEMVLRKAGNKGKYSNRRRKAKRDAEATIKQEEEDMQMEDSSEAEEWSRFSNLVNDASRNEKLAQSTSGPSAHKDKPSSQHRGRKRGLSEASSDGALGSGDGSHKRQKRNEEEDEDTEGVRYINSSSKRDTRKVVTSPSALNLNQGVAAKASGRTIRAARKAGRRRKRSSTALEEQKSESEYKESISRYSSRSERGSPLILEDDLSNGTISDATPQANGFGVRSNDTSPSHPQYSPGTDGGSPVDTPVEKDPDMRFRVPVSGPDINKLRRALQLTLLDLAIQCDQDADSMDEVYDLKLHEKESYVSQHRYMQQRCREPLFFLSEWTGGFGNWTLEEGDEVGPLLQGMLSGGS
ncbi:hypothetical protein P7C71_g3046, partial [Lecanoromycetidae sp. Uapishka_2]